MSFEEFRVSVVPEPNSPFAKGCDTVMFQQVIAEIRSTWQEIRPDIAETERLFSPKEEREELLVYHSAAGLFQLTVLLGNVQPDTISVHLRVAYCNPRTVHAPFCDVIAGLMDRYTLCAYCSEPAPPGGDMRETIPDLRDVRTVLIPRLDYNRGFWQQDAQTTEEAILRPGDAVARFIMPLTVPLHPVKA